MKVNEPMSNALVERRKSPRYRCRNNLVHLSWSQGDGIGEAHARLLDLSRCGASVDPGRTLPTSGAVWLSLGEPTPTLRVWTEVVWQDASNRAGLAFPTDCPLDVFHAATLAIGFGNLFGE